MTDASPLTSSETPKHLWIIGIVALLWNSMGAFDYYMTNTQNATYMAEFTAEQLEFFYNFPTWVVAFWAVAVWGGVLGAVLLIMKKRMAAPVLLVSFVAMVVTAVHNFGIANGAAIMGVGGAIFSVVIFIASLALVIYARKMAAQGVLT